MQKKIIIENLAAQYASVGYTYTHDLNTYRIHEDLVVPDRLRRLALYMFARDEYLTYYRKNQITNKLRRFVSGNMHNLERTNAKQMRESDCLLFNLGLAYINLNNQAKLVAGDKIHTPLFRKIVKDAADSVAQAVQSPAYAQVIGHTVWMVDRDGYAPLSSLPIIRVQFSHLQEPEKLKLFLQSLAQSLALDDNSIEVDVQNITNNDLRVFLTFNSTESGTKPPKIELNLEPMLEGVSNSTERC